jgi:ATP-dependent RNA helicase DeaD
MSDATEPRESAPTFDALPLSSAVRRAIDELGFTAPTPVQRAAYAPAAEGKDLIVQSRTGTGKTLAFGLPLVDRLVRPGEGTSALILAPTRELSLQSERALNDIGKYLGVRSVAIYGGAPMERQVAQLRDGVEIVSGTPGRVLDHIRRGTLDPSGIRVLVLDEADEMFSMGFAKEPSAIMDALPVDRQLLCFSATIDDNVQRMAERRMHEPEFITLSSDQVGASLISHFYYMVLGDKVSALIRVLEAEDPESAIIFCNMKSETESVAKSLSAAGFNADWLNGDLPQRDREQIMKRTREGKLRYMVATDVAARGIDISHLTHVINFGFPESAEQYVHRTGRTGRAGRTGTAISVLGPGNLGALYYLRLTFKIFPIERSLPSETELRTRREADRVSLLADAFRESPLDEHLDVVRRLLTRPDAERVLAGLVRNFFGALAGDVSQTAAAARREHESAVIEHDERALAEPEAAPLDMSPPAELASASGDTVSTGAGGAGRKRRRRRRGRGEGSDASLDLDDLLDPEPLSAPSRDDDSEGSPIVIGQATEPASDARGAAVAMPAIAEVLEARPELADMTTLYFNVGRRDGLEPQDLTELLSSECALALDDIGRVRVKDRHTFVGVPTGRADAVIAALAGRTVRSRELHIERARA